MLIEISEMIIPQGGSKAAADMCIIKAGWGTLHARGALEEAMRKLTTYKVRRGIVPLKLS